MELYNTSSNEISLKDIKIGFGSDSQTLIFCEADKILGNGYKLIYLSSSWLANTGDIVTLVNGDDQIDAIGYGSGYSLGKPTSSSSITRFPDGGPDWILTTDISPQGEILSFDCPTLAPTASPTPTEAAPYKATYNINSPRDGNGAILTSVQIYVDGAYIHHEDKETLYFFNGHECYTDVDCSLGVHTISLRKSGYSSWEDTKDFVAGSSFEVDPALNTVQTPTPESTVLAAITPKPTVFKTSTPSAQPTATVAATLKTPLVLGLKNNFEETSTNNAENKGFNRYILPVAIIAIGIGFIGASIFSIIRNAKKGHTEAL